MKQKLYFLIISMLLIGSTIIGINVFANNDASPELLKVWEKRADLQKAFPKVKNKDYIKLIEWSEKYGWKEDESLIEYSPMYSKFSGMMDRKIEQMYNKLQVEFNEKLATNNGNEQDNDNHNEQISCNITCPQGEKGDKGEQGIQGKKGDTGEIPIGGSEEGEWLICYTSEKNNYISSSTGEMHVLEVRQIINNDINCRTNEQWANAYNTKYGTNYSELTYNQITELIHPYPDNIVTDRMIFFKLEIFDLDLTNRINGHFSD